MDAKEYSGKHIRFSLDRLEPLRHKMTNTNLVTILVNHNRKIYIKKTGNTISKEFYHHFHVTFARKSLRQETN